MNIGEAARASGVSAKMIRYYEQTGLIPPADRRPSGYRDYSAADVHVLIFIRRARDVGFPVAEIHKLLQLWSNRARKSADVKRIALAHIADLRLKIQKMEQMAATLEDLAANCAGDNRPDCPILADLENMDAAEDSGGFGPDAASLTASRRKSRQEHRGRSKRVSVAAP